MLLVCATRAKLTPNLSSLSRMRYFGLTPKAVASRSCCAVQASVGDRVTPTWITLRECSSMLKKANSERKKRSVTGRKSQAQICSACVRKKVFQFCPCGRVVLTCRIYFCMVRLQTRIPNLSNSPRIRSARHSRMSLAISVIKATISADILDVRAAALDVYFQKSRKPWRCHRSNVVFLNDEEGLFPGSNHSCQTHQDYAVRFGTGRAFHVSAQDN